MKKELLDLLNGYANELSIARFIREFDPHMIVEGKEWANERAFTVGLESPWLYGALGERGYSLSGQLTYLPDFYEITFFPETGTDNMQVLERINLGFLNVSIKKGLQEIMKTEFFWSPWNHNSTPIYTFPEEIANYAWDGLFSNKHFAPATSSPMLDSQMMLPNVLGYLKENSNMLERVHFHDLDKYHSFNR